MRRCRDDVAVGEGVVHQLGGHQPADVRHVRHQVGAVLVGDLPEALVVEVTRVAADACERSPPDNELHSIKLDAVFTFVFI